MIIRALTAALVLFAVSTAPAQTQWPNQQAGDYAIKDFRFASGETIAELKLHYVTLGTAKRDAASRTMAADRTDSAGMGIDGLLAPVGTGQGDCSLDKA